MSSSYTFLSTFVMSSAGGLVLIYVITKLIQWYRSYMKMVAIYDALPGDREKHWLWGHLHLYPGPNEAGLKFQRDMVAKYPLFHRFWVGVFRASVVCNHPESAKILLKSSGNNTFPGPGESGLQFWREQEEKYPYFYRIWRGPVDPMVIVVHPETANVILKTSEPKPMGVGTVYVLAMDWLGKGLLIANGERWARNRRLLTPAFHFDILKPYISVYNSVADILLEKVEDCCKENKSFELFSYMGLASLDSILRCACSYQSDCQIVGESHPYFAAVHELCDLWVERSLNLLHYPDIIFYMTSKGRRFKKHSDYVHKVAEDIIKKRQKTLKEEGLPVSQGEKKSRYLDFLDVLITAKDDTGQGMTLLEIRNEVDTFLFEGHDTTNSAMSWTLYSLAEHQECQTRVQKELDSLLQGRDSDDIEWNDLPKLEYLTMCIKEGMRLHSPVSFIQRVTTKPCEMNGYTIPAGTNVAVQIYNVHHNHKVWDNPLVFNPDRFLPENARTRDNYAFIPFSAGPRNCIGQHFAMNEMKVFLARLLRKYTLTLDPDHKATKKISVVMRAENGIKVYAKHRENRF